MTGKTAKGSVWSFSFLLVIAVLAGCLPKPPSESGDINITVYAFSIMKEPLEKGIFPGFAAKWKQTHGQDVRFTSSFAGSETVTNQILQGVDADVAILSIERDLFRLRDAKFVNVDWRKHPYKSILNKTPFVIVVRGGNPKGIRDFIDLARPGIKIIHPDPVSSGGAQWSILAIYGAQLVKSEQESNEPDAAQALHALRAIWRNVKSTPGSAREARTQFETGFGDVLITYELEGLLMKQAKKTPIEIVVPKSTILSEHPAVMIDKNVPESKRAVVNAFMDYLWTDEAQKIFVQNYFYSVTNNTFNEANQQFGKIETPFTIEKFGGWERAYPEIIEKIFRDQVQRVK